MENFALDPSPISTTSFKFKLAILPAIKAEENLLTKFAANKSKTNKILVKISEKLVLSPIPKKKMGPRNP